MTLKIPI